MLTLDCRAEYPKNLSGHTTLVMGRVAIELRLGLTKVVFAAVASIIGSQSVRAEERANFFNDPFLQVTNRLANCPTPRGPEITRAEMLAQSHVRAERGTSCYLSGRCRLPNSYLYDVEIIPRVKKAIEADVRFAQSSVWVEGQRRWVTLKGCVRSTAEADALERLVRSIDDVEAVINELGVESK